MPQCSPGPDLGPAWPGRKSRGCAIRPGCGSGRALFGFGAGTLRPHPSLGLPGWLTHPTRVCWRPGAGKGWDFSPPFCRLAGSGLPLSRGRWGGGQQAAWGGEAGWGTCFPLLCGLPFALEEGERGARVVRWLGNLCAPRFRSWGRGSSGSFSNPTMFAAQFAFSYGAPGKDPLNQYP